MYGGVDRLEPSHSDRYLCGSERNGSVDSSVKVVMLGESGAGKSSLALRFIKDDFRPYSETTIGASYFSRTIDIARRNSNKCNKVEFKIWDTAGQEKYHSLAPMYYRGAGAAILVYDICGGVSFRTLQRWVDELREKGPPDIFICICGNKLDLARDRTVAKKDASDYAEQVGAFYIEASARDNINIRELFQEIALRVKLDQEKEQETKTKTVKLAPSSPSGASTVGGSCC